MLRRSIRNQQVRGSNPRASFDEAPKTQQKTRNGSDGHRGRLRAFSRIATDRLADETHVRTL
jgi:hypothetical protein